MVLFGCTLLFLFLIGCQTTEKIVETGDASVSPEEAQINENLNEAQDLDMLDEQLDDVSFEDLENISVK